MRRPSICSCARMRSTRLEAQGSHLENLAFLAMTHQQLGHAKEAQAELQRLRERDEGSALGRKMPRLQAFLREAEELLAKPKAPGSK